MTDVQSLRILKRIDSCGAESLGAVREKLVEMIRQEKSYKHSQGYGLLEPADMEGNRSLVFRYGLLKKYIESELYIKLNKKRDGFAKKS